jgi:hypothetical protein
VGARRSAALVLFGVSYLGPQWLRNLSLRFTLKPFIWLVGAFSPVAGFILLLLPLENTEIRRSPSQAPTQFQWHKRCSSTKRSAATGIDKRPQLDWRGSSLQDKGLLQLQTWGEPIELHFSAVTVNPPGDQDRLYVSL